jgi:2-methylcitrate dehydratase PrpD
MQTAPGSMHTAYGAAIARHAASAAARELPAEVLARAKLHVLDTFAAIVSGSALEAGQAGQHYARSVGGAPRISILGTAIRAPLVEAVLANGMAAHADESDDSHEESQTHPGCGVVPAALGVAELCRSSGLEFVRAVVLGGGMTFSRSPLSSHAYGPLFGGGYAAGVLMGFNEERFRVLLNYLAQEASGLTTWRLDERHTLKSYVFAGMPASNAVKVAALVRSGFSGSGDVLDPEDRNMLAAICPDPRPGALIERLNRVNPIMETHIKKYPVGYPIAVPLAALESILDAHHPAPDEIVEVRIHYHEDWYKVVGERSRMPDVNLRYCLAAALLDGRLTFDAAHDAARMAQPDVSELGRRIRLLGALPHLDRFAVRVEVDLGRCVLAAEQGRNVLGRAENPMSKRQVEDKAMELMRSAVGERRARRAVELLDTLERQPSLEEIIAEVTS